ncbi:MAG: DUF3088 family protein [Betaproteobacteria bacterium]
MSRDTLFMLDPDCFISEGKSRYCPDCALIAGYLSFYPAVIQELTLRVVAPPRPRQEIVALLGEENQSAPVLVLDRDAQVPSGIAFGEINGQRFINDPKAILAYLGQKHTAGGMPL